MRLALRAASLRGPGLPGWTQSLPVLCDPSLWTDGPVQPLPLTTLPPNERRRAGPINRLALSVAEEACAQASLNPTTVASLFASSNGDGGVIDSIMRALTTPGAEVSPTQFHNSVHNAAGGYWPISHNSISPATAISCFDWTFGTGLLKAAAEAITENHPVLFVAYDMPIPGPIGTVRITPVSFACAFVLDPTPDAPAIAQLVLSYNASAPDMTDVPEHPAFRSLALGNPAARSLPLFRLLALRQAGTISAGCLNGALRIEVTPC